MYSKIKSSTAIPFTKGGMVWCNVSMCFTDIVGNVNIHEVQCFTITVVGITMYLKQLLLSVL